MINVSVIQGVIQENVKEFATKTGSMFSKFSILNTSQNGKYENKVYVPVMCFGKASEAARGLQAGTLVTIEGSISTRKNETTGKYDMSITAHKLVSLGSPRAPQQAIPQASFDEQDVPF